MTKSSEKNRLADFFRTEYSKLIGFVRRRVDQLAAQDAEDFVHDVAVQLFHQGDIAAPIENLSAYVYRSLSNRIVDHFRKRTHLRQISDTETEDMAVSLDQIIVESGYDSASEMRNVEITHDLIALMDGLKEEERTLIVATDIQGYTFEQLSEAWDIPLNTLLSRKSRALKKLQRQIQSRRE